MTLYGYIRNNDIAKFENELESYVHEIGYNILHETISRGRVEMVDMILNKFPMLACGVDEPNNNTPLVYAIWGRDKDLITKIARVCPESFRVPNSFGDLPMFHAVKTLNLDIVKQVYEVDKDAIRTKNKMGWYPLHNAASYGSLKISKFLYEEYPEQIHETDMYNQTPLHLCGKFLNNEIYTSKSTVENRLIRFLADKCPSAVNTRNTLGDLPIHTICMKCVVLKNPVRDDILHLVELYPESLQVANNNGMMPIHVASFFHDIDLVKMFSKLSPETLYAKNRNGKSPFEYFENASPRVRNELYAYILTTIKSDGVWDHIPKPSPGIEKHVSDINAVSVRDARRLINDHFTPIARKRINVVYGMLRCYADSKNMNVETDILKNITLLSL